MTSNTPGGGRILGSLRSADGVGVVRIEDRYDTAIDDLWAAITEPDRLARWYGQVEGDLQLGGAFRMYLAADDIESTGRVEACEPPQRLLVSVEVWLSELRPPAEDHPAEAWNYDFLRTEVAELAGARRYNLQETLVHAIFERVAAFHGVRALRVRLSKPDVYADAKAVGVEVASFPGLWPDG